MPKRTKAIKVTDRKKPWCRKAEPSTYEIETRETNKIILIVGEGQTEKLYFDSFPVLTLSVQVADLCGQRKLKLIEATEEIVKNSDREYDKIWCVFDMDLNQGEKEYADFDNAIESAKARGYGVAYSNDSFELWFYLHYFFTQQRNHRKFYYQALGEKWDCNYQKEGKRYEFCQTIYARLEKDEKASQTKAIERAEKLFEDQAHLKYHEQNPVTKVYELVRCLNENSRR